MLTCLPQSLCSWNYTVSGASAGPASLHFNFLSEQGTLSLGHITYAVRKHGPLSGFWTLEHAGVVYAEAHKPSLWQHRFNVRGAETALTVASTSLFMRQYEIRQGYVPVGSIRPVHAFTRRAIIQSANHVPELLQLFSFWLVVLLWRRDTHAKNG